MVKREGGAVHLIGAGWLFGNHFHTDGSHADLGEVAEGFEDAAGVLIVPLEKCEVETERVIQFGQGHPAIRATQHRGGLGVDVGEGGVADGLRVGSCLVPDEDLG